MLAGQHALFLPSSHKKFYVKRPASEETANKHEMSSAFLVCLGFFVFLFLFFFPAFFSSFFSFFFFFFFFFFLSLSLSLSLSLFCG